MKDAQEDDQCGAGTFQDLPPAAELKACFSLLPPAFSTELSVLGMFR